MEKITIHDADFGALAYHKQLAPVDFHGADHLCYLPFNYMEVNLQGQVHVCCPVWNPATIGNVLENTVQEIWQGARVNLIRDTIFDGSFKYCNNFACPDIRANTLHRKTDHNVKRIHDLTHLTTPRTIAFVVDRSCNLA